MAQGSHEGLIGYGQLTFPPLPSALTVCEDGFLLSSDPSFFLSSPDTLPMASIHSCLVVVVGVGGYHTHTRAHIHTSTTANLSPSVSEQNVLSMNVDH